ncbi:transcriptional regulator [Spongiactinospora rosea]|uniref:Transcriptional regulator n=1 Tax=Spongiactinospora rosea TaxID=2248750 RepID=A0A366M407_9ACTN|nr:transcriptional regulator [Spongiactinospora rosea]
MGSGQATSTRVTSAVRRPNATQSSSSVLAARRLIAQRLRELRLDAGLSARALAAAAGWHESKSSRIENAKTPPSDDDLRAWCGACGADGEVEELIAASRQADEMYVEWRRVHRAGLRRTQESGIARYEATRHFRVYCSHVVPGLLQTAAYARALLASVAAFRGLPDDSEAAAQARLTRSRVLHEGDHRFAILMEESVLRYRIGDADVMSGQLDHLLTVMALPRVSLGVIPQTESRRLWPVEAFHIFDDRAVKVELLTASVNVTQPREIAQYAKGFDELAAMARYGRHAHDLIAQAHAGLT